MFGKIGMMIGILLFYFLSAILCLFRGNIYLFLYSTIFIPYFVLLPITCLGVWASIKSSLKQQWKQLIICAAVTLGAIISFCFTSTDILDIRHYTNDTFEETRGKIAYVTDGEDYGRIGQTIAVVTKDGIEEYESFQYRYDAAIAEQTVQITYLPKTGYILSLIILE
ncbi:hypothetical protein [Terribacillus saccharophilus]|jgi:hypothetical protein|uniref:DUF3592 domain-containing protein n=1 Tax=Terribacillus saccharophilus TaxID=361277 RepID=A0ABX4GY01_9BACI|nr:hypothetical protein [Terribacillus saccharophilus]PAD35178.1 hypothetical protein CHH56_10545 [Terribacillus saccharophilus]PAD95927.1 hypothetical protein CHH50_10740 [Terribacillus saccharophilus]PAD99749.1 hypothetical protein CHH48_10895 [Terribacillus saccharophilus]